MVILPTPVWLVELPTVMLSAMLSTEPLCRLSVAKPVLPEFPMVRPPPRLLMVEPVMFSVPLTPLWPRPGDSAIGHGAAVEVDVDVIHVERAILVVGTVGHRQPAEQAEFRVGVGGRVDGAALPCWGRRCHLRG